MAEFGYEIVGTAAENGWQMCGRDSHLSTAAAAWQAVADIAKRSDPAFAASLRKRTATGAVEHEGTRYSVSRLA